MLCCKIVFIFFLLKKNKISSMAEEFVKNWYVQHLWLFSQRFTIMSLGFQVNLLIDNEAEKDYLYDVLRMYHQ